MKEVILKVLLDDVAFVTETDDELIDPVVGIDLHDMPDDRHAADLDHRFWLGVCFLGESRSEAPRKKNCFHHVTPETYRLADPLDLSILLARDMDRRRVAEGTKISGNLAAPYHPSLPSVERFLRSLRAITLTIR
jgi:hypothetical protein